MSYDQRAALEALIRENGADFAGLSRLLGRNAAYIQQFVKRGVPRRLDPEDARKLAQFFGVGEDVLASRTASKPPSALIAVPRYAVQASAGHGTFVDDEALAPHIGFAPGWLRQIARGRPEDVSCIEVQGDSMAPTLNHGDDILVDSSDAVERLRDGIYVLRRDETLMVKRLALDPVPGRVTVKSDNDAYPQWPSCEIASLKIIGRVVWSGRRIG